MESECALAEPRSATNIRASTRKVIFSLAIAFQLFSFHNGLHFLYTSTFNSHNCSQLFQACARAINKLKMESMLSVSLLRVGLPWEAL